jgi:hypothetical protein
LSVDKAIAACVAQSTSTQGIQYCHTHHNVHQGALATAIGVAGGARLHARCAGRSVVRKAGPVAPAIEQGVRRHSAGSWGHASVTGAKCLPRARLRRAWAQSVGGAVHVSACVRRVVGTNRTGLSCFGMCRANPTPWWTRATGMTGAKWQVPCNLIVPHSPVGQGRHAACPVRFWNVSVTIKSTITRPVTVTQATHHCAWSQVN